MIWWVCSVMLSSPSDKRGISPLPSSSSWTHTFMQSTFNITDTLTLIDTDWQTLLQQFDWEKNYHIYPSWEIILLLIWKNEKWRKSEKSRCIHTNKRPTKLYNFLNVLNRKKHLNQLHFSLESCYNTCKPTQVSHDPSFNWSILTVLLQVDYKRYILKKWFREDMLYY